MNRAPAPERSALIRCMTDGDPGLGHRLLRCAVDVYDEDARVTACRYCPICYGRRPPATLILRITNAVGIPYSWSEDCGHHGGDLPPCASIGGDYECHYLGFLDFPENLPPWYCYWASERRDVPLEYSRLPCHCQETGGSLFAWIALNWNSVSYAPPFVWGAGLETPSGQVYFESQPFTPQSMVCSVAQPLTLWPQNVTHYSAEAQILLPS